MIIDNINNVHQGSVVIRDNYAWSKTPDTLGKYRWYVPDIPDPRIVHYLQLIVIYKTIEKGVEIYGEGDKQ